MKIHNEFLNNCGSCYFIKQYHDDIGFCAFAKPGITEIGEEVEVKMTDTKCTEWIIDPEIEEYENTES